MPAPYQFSVIFEIKNDDINARFEMPKNFLDEEPKFQVNIISGLRDQFQQMDLGELDLTTSYDTDVNKRLLLSKFSELFPLASVINVGYDTTAKDYFIDIKHEENMSSIPKLLQPIFVALVIAALTSAGTLIVASHEGYVHQKDIVS
jgi:hypothetical protein